MTLGSELRRLRTQAGMTQRQLADAAGIAQSFVAMLEKDQRDNPSLAVLCRVASVFGVPPDRLTRFVVPEPLRVEPPAARIVVPVCGLAAAGPEPVVNLGQRGYLDVTAMFAEEDLRAVEVRGDSMVDELIGDGDVVMFVPDPDPPTGETVVALVDGGLIVKVLAQKYGIVEFLSRNRNIAPLKYDPSKHDISIWGVVHSVHRFGCAVGPKKYGRGAKVPR